jgi:hypothetical protein
MSEKKLRTELEQEILNSAKKVRFEHNAGCFEEDALREFWEAWRRLVQYYEDENHNDTEIGVEVIHEYLDKINLFFGVWQDQSASEHCRERSEESLQELEAYLDYIMQAVEIRLYPDGR